MGMQQQAAVNDVMVGCGDCVVGVEGLPALAHTQEQQQCACMHCSVISAC